MPQQVCSTGLLTTRRERRQGPLQHFGAALVAALFLPLSSVAATPATAQTTCTGGSITGLVWLDANNNGIQDPGETGIGGVIVSTVVGETAVEVETDESGHYEFCGLVPGVDYTIVVVVPPGDTPSPSNNPATSDFLDSDGLCCIVSEGEPDRVTVVTSLDSFTDIDFGFWHEAVVTAPGTGTPGYWKNHPEAWPVASIQIGSKIYTKQQAIALLGEGGSDKSITMFSSLLSAKLSVLVGNKSYCVDETIIAADSWMVTYGPAPSSVKASGIAWKAGEPLHRILDNYNNGMLCAPHRN